MKMNLRQLFDELNKEYFNDKLPSDISLKWENLKGNILGQWRYNKKEIAIDTSLKTYFRKSQIPLFSKSESDISLLKEVQFMPVINTSTDRLKRVLFHEMCHAWREYRHIEEIKNAKTQSEKLQAVRSYAEDLLNYRKDKHGEIFEEIHRKIWQKNQKPLFVYFDWSHRKFHFDIRYAPEGLNEFYRDENKGIIGRQIRYQYVGNIMWETEQKGKFEWREQWYEVFFDRKECKVSKMWNDKTL